MKRTTLVLSLLGALSLYGCTLDEPLNLGVKCSNSERSLSAVVYNTTVCHVEDVTGELKEVCGGFADAFKYGHCPPESPICIDEDGEFMCSVSKCHITHHEHNGQCELNTLLHCGQHKYECEETIPGWIDGVCRNELTGAKCIPNTCESGYKIDAMTGNCTALLECLENEHIANGTCEVDSLENCGRHGYACASKVSGWLDGQCIDSVCVPSACEAGYRLEDDKCIPTVECEVTEHIYVAEDSNCEADTVSNCGRHGYACDTLEGWVDGNCIEGRCNATACEDKYVLNKEVGTCRLRMVRCDDATEHVYEDACEPNSVQHCGMHNNDCTSIAGWKDGSCEYAPSTNSTSCVASACELGYELKDGKCEALKSCDDPDQHYFNGECNPNDLDNCGRHNNRCADNAGWGAGSCVRGVCVATDCEVGYEVIAGKCEAKVSCDDPDTHYYNGECIPNDLENCGKHNHRCASLAGWGEGSCVSGECVPSLCIVGYHVSEDGSRCEGDNNDVCGPSRERCINGKICSYGECRDNCVGGEVRCAEVCADPKTSVQYCGTDETCSNYEPCEDGQACVEGHCVQSLCMGETTLCVVGGENQCILLNSDNANHCGACNHKCEEQQALNAHSSMCVDGHCQFVCNDDYTNCGSSTLPNCIKNADFLKDPFNCGSCGNKCGDDEYCSGGACVKNTCTNSCLSNSECVNENDKCGTKCVNCNTNGYAAAGECNAGACVITQCAAGYHLGEVDGDIKCVPNTATACAPVDSSDVVNCTNQNNAADGYCNALGTCVSTSCLTGFHIENGVCVEDSQSACGAAKTNCTGLAGWSNGSCQNGVCVATACQSGFCLNGSTCVDGTYNSLTCGADGGGSTCLFCGDGKSCVAGTCVTSSCGANVCFYQGEECENAATHCGSSCTDCTTAGSASAGTCEAGVCKITACSAGYHLKGSAGNYSCEANTATACAPSDSTALTDCTTANNASNGICGTDGRCIITNCKANYHLVEGSCVEDSNNACGASAVNCTSLDGWDSGKCEAGVCKAQACKSGYCLNGTTCVNGSSNSMMCAVNGGSAQCVSCSSSEACVNSECITSNCADNVCFYQGDTCSNTDDHCGKSCMNCNTAGNASVGTCSDGVCKITKCAAGYHLTGTAGNYACEANSAAKCGPVDAVNITNCNNSGNATSGVCNSDGQCVALSCALGYHVSAGRCVNDTVNACGAGANDCTQLAGWSNGECFEGQCKAELCKTGYCLNGTTCVDGSFNSKTCGVSGGSVKCMTCSSGTSCSSGACITSSCESHQCFYQGESCSNTADHCGSACMNCNAAGNASAGICTEDGTCKITACANGYHLVNSGGTYSCEMNTTEKCGAPGSTETVNCNTANNASSGICGADGTCTITGCKSNFHLDSGICVADTELACGPSALNCTTLPGWSGGSCVSGSCQALACKSNYCLDGSTCVEGTANSLTCGISGGACTKCGSKEACVNGACTTSSCAAATCFYQGETCSNADDHCGTNCMNCNTANNASEGTCNSGVCKITKCAIGYHLKGSAGNYSCELNDADKCGKPDSTATVNCKTYNHSTSGVCNSNGTCTAITCETGYHVKNGSCVEDSNMECGAGAMDCRTLDGWAAGTCEGGQCKASSCSDGFCLNGTTCVDGSFNSKTCGVSGGSNKCIACGTGTSCSSGTCVTSSCGDNQCFYQGTSCSNTADHCGSACLNCNVAGNASAGTCVSGACRISDCASGYHLKGSSSANYVCEANTAYKCGAHNSTTTVDCTNSNHGTAGFCHEGTCQYTACEPKFHVKNGQCEADTAEACGPGAVNCSDLDGWRTGECVDGVCKASTCSSGFCLNSTGTCVNGSSNSLACGISGGTSACTVCEGTDACIGGACKTTSCDANVCYYEGTTCSNTADHCGKSCINCNTANHAAVGTCSSTGVCSITKCSPGYHMRGSSCVQNTATACAGVSSSSEVDCTSANNASAGYCNDSGQCVITACKLGYHRSGDKCIEDNDTACGEDALNCKGLAGWKAGSCINGVCKASACNSGYCLKDDTCYDGTSTSSCGIEGGSAICKVCDSGLSCISGACKVSGCGGNECFYNGTTCMNETEHCGVECRNCNTANHAATGTCNSGTCKISTCASGYHLEGSAGNYTCAVNTATSCGSTNSVNFANCNEMDYTSIGYCNDSGQCMASVCQDGAHLADGKCIKDSVSACGPALTKCDTLAGWAGGQCTSGQCVATKCNGGYCLSGGTCINGKSNSAACGISGGTNVCKACGDAEACIGGACKPTSCSGNACYYNGSCVNDADRCGSECVNCNTAGNAAVGTCSSGTCSITNCAQGYHKTSTGKCEVNTSTSCGPVDSYSIQNCMTLGSITTNGYCNDAGQCVATACKTGYHVESNKCVADTNTACGAVPVNCKELPGWEDGKCMDGVCVANKCETNYCISNDTCVNGASDAMACGVKGGTSECKFCGAGKSCIDGECVVTSCSGNECYYHNACVNDAEHCGSDCIDCTSANHATAGSCSAGTCTITDCDPGYHLASGSCVLNTNTSCAPTNSSVTKNCMVENNASYGICALDGSCVIVSCRTGYYYEEQSCKLNDEANCGSSGHTCDKDMHFVCNTMIGACECEDGYTPSGGGCVKESLCEDHYTEIDIDGFSGRAYCIESLEDLEKIYNGGVSSDTNAYILMKDFDLNELSTADTWKPIFGEAFKGVFYGNGKTLSGSLACSSSCGVFAPLQDATIKSLNLNVNITGMKPEIEIGAISATADNATVEGVTFSGNITASDAIVGGLFSRIYSGTTIKNCIVSGKVIGGTPVGGFVGRMYGGSINNSYFNGMVIGDRYVGGFIGLIAGSVSDITIDQSGIFGYVKGSESNGSEVGGFIGYIESGSAVITLKSSFSVADVTSKKTIAGITTLVGAKLTIHDVYHLGDLKGNEESFDDILLKSGSLNENYYSSWAKLKSYKEHEYIDVSGSELILKGEPLVKGLNQYSKDTHGREMWTTRTCTISTGPAGGGSKKYVLPLPKKFPTVSFCE